MKSEQTLDAPLVDKLKRLCTMTRPSSSAVVQRRESLLPERSNAPKYSMTSEMESHSRPRGVDHPAPTTTSMTGHESW